MSKRKLIALSIVTVMVLALCMLPVFAEEALEEVDVRYYPGPGVSSYCYSYTYFDDFGSPYSGGTVPHYYNSSGKCTNGFVQGYSPYVWSCSYHK